MDFVPQIQGSPPPHPKPIEEQLMTKTVNGLSELESRFAEINGSSQVHFDNAVEAMLNATKRELWPEGETPEYSEIASYVGEATVELSYIAGLSDIRGQFRSLRDFIIFAKNGGKGQITTIEGEKGDIKKGFYLKLPAVVRAGIIDVEMNKELSGAFVYKIYDLSGRAVQRGRIAGLSSGFHRLPLNLNNLKSGVYIIRINVDKKEIVKKITIVE